MESSGFTGFQRGLLHCNASFGIIMRALHLDLFLQVHFPFILGVPASVSLFFKKNWAGQNQREFSSNLSKSPRVACRGETCAGIEILPGRLRYKSC